MLRGQAMEVHECCWHNTGTILLSFPPQIPQVCCICGTERKLMEKQGLIDPNLHGPYLPNNERYS